jgi:CubicO group peptidase (beta-lactamase class C family)
MSFAEIEEAFSRAAGEVFPGAVVLASRGGEEVFCRAFGWRSCVPEREAIDEETVFDLASLTKPLATATAMMLLVQERRLSLEDRACRFLPELGEGEKRDITIRHLLAHCSGLPAWRPYYEEVASEGLLRTPAGRDWVLRRARAEELVSAPGRAALYSDLGFMLLAEIAETVTGEPFDRYCERRIFAPLGMRSTFFIDLKPGAKAPPVGLERVAPTRCCSWRGRVLRGEVDDDNAYAMGGVAGHAGLFSTARDIDRLVRCLRACHAGADGFIDAGIVREFLARDRNAAGCSFALGWDTPSAKGSASGGLFSEKTVGHLGFTGTSLWWDLERDCHIILLTNRVHIDGTNEKIRQFRPYIHDLLMRRILQ